MIKIFNKLVRDNIPNIITSQGNVSHVETLDDNKYIEELKLKLHEEVSEFCEDLSVEEFADIVQVLYSVKKTLGFSDEEIELVRAEKEVKNGAFEKKIFLKSIEYK